MNLLTILLTVILLILSGLFSGLNLGLLGLNIDELKRKSDLGNLDAKKLYPIRQKGNLLLCTLLIGNVAVNSALSIFLGSIVNGFIAMTISTALIVIFGEIIPQASISRYALSIGAKTLWITKTFIFILYPISAPLAFFLDKLLGDELPQVWSKEELKEIIKFHEDSPHSNIDEDEERIMLGALSFSHKKAVDIMTPRTMIYYLEKKTIIDDKLMEEIRKQRHTRIPIFDKNRDNIVGIVHIKDLIGIKLPLKVTNIYHNYEMLKIKESTNLDTILNLFIQKRTHIAFVYDGFAGLSGIVTMEDVIEEIIQKEVYDEGEKIEDPREVAFHNADNLSKQE